MKRIVALVLVAASLVGGLLFLPRAGRVAGVDAQDAVRETFVVAPETEVADVSVAGVALPDLGRTSTPSEDAAGKDMPLRDMFDELDVAAHAGDARAACRLGAELSRCAMVRRMARFDNEEQHVTQLAQQTLDEHDMQREIDAIAARKALVESTQEHCEGMTPDMLRNAGDYFTMAALAGHTPSQVRFVSGHHLRLDALLRDATPLQTYRTNAAALFREALHAGDLSLLGIWYHSAIVGDEMPLTAHLPEQFRDPGLVVALINRLSAEQRESMFPAGSLDTNRVTPTAEQVRAADALYTRHFATSPPIPREWDSADPAGSTKRLLSVEPYRCDEALR